MLEKIVLFMWQYKIRITKYKFRTIFQNSITYICEPVGSNLKVGRPCQDNLYVPTRYLLKPIELPREFISVGLTK